MEKNILSMDKTTGTYNAQVTCGSVTECRHCKHQSNFINYILVGLHVVLISTRKGSSDRYVRSLTRASIKVDSRHVRDLGMRFMHFAVACVAPSLEDL